MVQETILQHWVVTKFILPFFLVFFIVFALLEKTNILGEDKSQLNAFLAIVIGLIFVGAVFPKVVVGNMVLFLTVALVVVFVGLLIWGFLSGGEAKIEGKAIKIIGGAVVVIAVILGLVWAGGWDLGFLGWLFNQEWSKPVWTNVAFIVAIAAALAWVLKTTK